ncbi:MAG: 50S ribosomal protein L13 [Acidobacteria bacterium]|nr:50S ribosomal protein L13 [Acidobacteriota bacterium]
MATFLAEVEKIERKWYVIDAADQTLGRLASRIASILMGKTKAIYTPFLDTGDFVVVVNAEKVRLTGKKWDQKTYYHHTGYPGGVKKAVAKEIAEKNPERILESAVKGMLPKNKLGDRFLRKLKIYTGQEHPHQAQKPEPLTL